MDDTAWVERLILGDARAWSALVERSAPMLHACVARVLPPGAPGADVDDVVQTVFLKLWRDDCRRLKTFRGRSRLTTWLVAVARREAIDRLRAEAARPARRMGDRTETLETVARNGHAAGGTDAVDGGDELRHLLAHVDRLPPRDRLLVRLIVLDGCSYEETARLLDVPKNSLSPWLQRARQRLADSLGERSRPATGADAPYGSEGGRPLTERRPTPWETTR